jgi:hypothetical protein
MNAHSSILGGSNAQRLLTCPASYHEQLKSTVADIESIYAAEGTMLHNVVADCITRKISASMLRAVGYKTHLPIILTEEQTETVAKGLDALEEIKNRYPGMSPWRVAGLELRLPLPGVTGAFGSVDLVLINDVAVIILDWKFGAGVPVYAIYDLPDGSQQVNAQAMFYACCARAKFKRRFKGRKVVVAIVQPRLDPTYSLVETDEAELADFHQAFDNAVQEALGRHAHRERGDHCRFATCKSTCPLWTGPVFDLAILEPQKAMMRAAAEPASTEYGAFLSHALTLAEIAETWAEEIRRQAHVFMEDGGAVREWKLVPKRGTRKWVGSEGTTAEALMKAGVDHADIYTKPELKSVKQVEDAIKPKKLTVPAELFTMVSTGTTIARTEDVRPESTHGTVINDLRKALKAL